MLASRTQLLETLPVSGWFFSRSSGVLCEEVWVVVCPPPNKSPLNYAFTPNDRSGLEQLLGVRNLGTV